MCYVSWKQDGHSQSSLGQHEGKNWKKYEIRFMGKTGKTAQFQSDFNRKKTVKRSWKEREINRNGLWMDRKMKTNDRKKTPPKKCCWTWFEIESRMLFNDK